MIGKDAVVRAIFLDMMSIFKTILFVALFSCDSFNSVGAFLEIGKEVLCSNINKESADGILAGGMWAMHGVR